MLILRARRGDAVPACHREREYGALRPATYPLLLVLNGALVARSHAARRLPAAHAAAAARRRGVFGSKLTLRLVLLFALVAVLPGALVYACRCSSSRNSIESWFDVRIDKALEGGLNLGRTRSTTCSRTCAARPTAMAPALSERAAVASSIAALNTLREQSRRVGGDAVSHRRRGHRLRRQRKRTSLMPELPTAAALRQVRLQQPYARSKRSPTAACTCAWWCR